MPTRTPAKPCRMSCSCGPKEARALQLMAEVDRQEQEYNKLRQDKEQIHKAALDAWQKGDVSSALAKLGLVLELDRKAPDGVKRESGARYQTFYNEVRSEHDAMNTAYAEARKQLADRNFAKAIATCQTYLAKYPNNAIFQALRYDIEEQQRQELSSLIAQVDRQVEAEAGSGQARQHSARGPGEASRGNALRARSAAGAGQARSGQLHRCRAPICTKNKARSAMR